MIFLLIIVLLVNSIISYKRFHNWIVPPLLINIGMLSASLMVLFFYKDWEIDKLSFETILILGLGTWIFTFYCCWISKGRCYQIEKKSHTFTLEHLNIRRLKFLYAISIAIGLLELLLKVYHLKTFFGNESLSILISSAREENMNGDNLFHYPAIIRMMSSYTIVLSPLTIWLICLKHFAAYKNKGLKILLLGHLIITILDALISGAKGSLFGIISRIVILFLYMYYSFIGDIKIPKGIYLRIALTMLLLLVTFKGLSELIGRQVSERTNIDLISEYCGAEIKNFDIYINSSSSRVRSKYFGAVSFHVLYEELNTNYGRPDSEGFQSIAGYTLGNVYTLFYSLHKDFGILGCFIFPIFIAFVSMFFYRKSLRLIRYPSYPNMYTFVYAPIAFSLFMSFFSNKFTESICNLGFFRSTIYTFIMIYFFKLFIIKNKIYG